MELPKFAKTPIQHADCCLSLSEPLVEKLMSLLCTQKACVLSIGSGTGLLEALLIKQAEKTSAMKELAGSVTVRGVEVLAETPNKYLTQDQLYFAMGTWDLCPAAAEASVWIFVYPRERMLMAQYINRYGARDKKVRMIVWLGPISDWEGYEFALSIWSGFNIRVLKGAECGVAEYEMMGIAERHV